MPPASKGKGCVGPSLLRQREGKRSGPSSLASPAGPFYPPLNSESGAAGQEVKGACRKPQEELRLQPAPPPPARALGTLVKPNPPLGKTGKTHRLGGGELLLSVAIPTSSSSRVCLGSLLPQKETSWREKSLSSDENK